MSSVVIAGNTSGSVTLSAPDVAGTTTLTLPSTSGTVALSGGAISGTTGSFSGNLSFNSGYGSAAVAYGCRAWVNFNGQGTVAIRASGNVSSITDNGTGDYTMNFTSAMPDGNYAFVGLSREDNSGGLGDHSVYLSRTEAYSDAASMRFRTGPTTAYTDHIRVMAAVFR